MGDSKVKNENMILDFTHVYRDEDIKDIDRFRYIDCSDIQETDMYCSKNAYEKIWGRIEPYGIQGIHYIDSGNYHYITDRKSTRLNSSHTLASRMPSSA